MSENTLCFDSKTATCVGRCLKIKKSKEKLGFSTPQSAAYHFLSLFAPRLMLKYLPLFTTKRTAYQLVASLGARRKETILPDLKFGIWECSGIHLSQSLKVQDSILP